MKHGRAISINSLSINSLTSKFKHRCGLVSLGDGSPFQYHLVAIALGLGIGLSGLCKALRGGIGAPWVSREKDSSQIEHCVGGLHNLGNNCFLNAILQALASCSSFLPFLKNMLEADDELSEEKAERMPLIFALASLLEDLCIIQEERTVLSPRRVMHALSLYVSNFNLTRQQDASEAFLHLFSSLRDELSLCYVPHSSSLADIILFPSRIYDKREGNRPECKRWKNVFGPFDGSIGSMLACRSCSCVLSLDIEHFHCLPLTPVLVTNGDIVDGCTLLDCLKYFTMVEQVDNYRCDRCWHIAATKHVYLRSEIDEDKVNKLRCCVNYGTCSCRGLFVPEEITWSESSYALKQLVITRCPKILCIHLQRASMNKNGEFIKREGHISFPLFLDLSPFAGASYTLGQAASVASNQKQCNKRQHLLVPRQVHKYSQLNMQELPHMSPIMDRRTASVEELARNATGNSSSQSCSNESSSNHCSATDPADDSGNSSNLNCSLDCAMDYDKGSDENGFRAHKNDASSSCSSESSMYCLAAVVEHYGRYGGGHYAAYRRGTSDTDDTDPVQIVGGVGRRWFYASDRQVSEVSEETVLAAEATLLFYERL